MVVFDTSGPVRREADFDAGADGAAPAGVAGAAGEHAGRREEGPVTIVGQRRTTLGVQQHVVDGVADLAGEQAERVDLGLVGEEAREDRAVVA
ncbi:hypothetical protein NS44R_14730, partial [Mammaliicoccus sciuri]